MAERYVKHHKVAIFGDLTLANSLDWCVVLCVTGWISFVLFQIGGSRPDTLVISSVFAGLALMFHTLCILADSPREPFSINPMGFLFFPALFYVALNTYLWSPFLWRGKEELLGLTQAVTIFWLVVQNFRTRHHVYFLLMALVLMACLGVLLGIMQFFHKPAWLPSMLDPLEGELYRIQLPEQYHGRASGFFGAPTSYAGFMLLIGFPLLAAGFCRRFSGMVRLFCVYAGLMMIGAIFLSMSRGALLLVVFGLFLLPLVVRAKMKTVIFFWLFSALMVGVTFFLLIHLNDTFAERIETSIEVGGESSRPVMWHAALKQFLDAPILGNGVGAYDFLFEDHRPEGFNRTPSHAHNDYLETLADQGIVGFLLFWAPIGVIGFLALQEWFRQPDFVRVGGAGRRNGSLRMPTPKFLIGVLGLGIALFCGHLSLEFHLRTPGLLMVFFLVLGLLVKCVPIERIEVTRKLSLRVSVMAVGFGLALILPLWLVPQYIGLMYAQNGQRMMTHLTRNMDSLKSDEAYFAATIDMLRKAVHRAPGNAEAWSDLSNVIAAQDYLHPGRGREFGREAEPFARRALQISTKLPQAWINLGNALTLQGRMVEAGEVYQKATELAPNRSDVWYYYAAHLNLLKSTRDQALEAVERSLALEPGREDAQKLRVKILVP